MEAAGLVQRIQTARTSPDASPSKISSAERPGEGAIRPDGTPQCLSTAVRAVSSVTARYPGSRWARPPVSRPPIALGWPVSEKGPAPGRPIWPVARCRLRMAAFLSVPT